VVAEGLRQLGAAVLDGGEALFGGSLQFSARKLEALQREQSRRSNFRFSNVGIAVGATLSFVKDDTITAMVVDDRTIEFEGVNTSTSNAARILLHRMGGTLSAAQGPLYWMYDGETLAERRMRLEAGEEQ
jgi:hypothetical protein